MAATGVISEFELPAELEASEPPEARGLRRDEVRLLVSDVGSDSIEHARFSDLPRWLAPGDLLVVNTSGTLNAALSATAEDGTAFMIHLSTRLPGGFWSVEVRRRAGTASIPYSDARAGTMFRLPGEGRIVLLAPYPLIGSIDAPSRLWIAALQLPDRLPPYLEQYGSPIRYGYVRGYWPSSMYQTVFATEPGSAEMPSAGRPFTPELVTALISRGVQIAPVLLHTGVASPEKHEPPYEEYYRVTRDAADRITAARRAGYRVIAVGTTVVRALETVTDANGITSPGKGWTNVVVSPDRPVRSVTGMITGLHEPRATHLAVLECVISATAIDRLQRERTDAQGRRHVERAYAEARGRGYLWHEFGDSHLIVGDRSRVDA